MLDCSSFECFFTVLTVSCKAVRGYLSAGRSWHPSPPRPSTCFRRVIEAHEYRAKGR